MLEAGTVLHLAGSGRLILRSNASLKINSFLYDNKGHKVAKVMEIFGPSKSPYVSATPLTDKITEILGKKLYTSKGDLNNC